MPYFAAQLQARKKIYRGRLSPCEKCSTETRSFCCNSTVSAAGQSSPLSKLDRKACGEPVKTTTGTRKPSVAKLKLNSCSRERGR